MFLFTCILKFVVFFILRRDKRQIFSTFQPTRDFVINVDLVSLIQYNLKTENRRLKMAFKWYNTYDYASRELKSKYQQNINTCIQDVLTYKITCIYSYDLQVRMYTLNTSVCMNLLTMCNYSWFMRIRHKIARSSDMVKIKYRCLSVRHFKSSNEY